MKKLRRPFILLGVLVAVFAATTLATAAYDYHCWKIGAPPYDYPQQ